MPEQCFKEYVVWQGDGDGKLEPPHPNASHLCCEHLKPEEGEQILEDMGSILAHDPRWCDAWFARYCYACRQERDAEFERFRMEKRSEQKKFFDEAEQAERRYPDKIFAYILEKEFMGENQAELHVADNPDDLQEAVKSDCIGKKCAVYQLVGEEDFIHAAWKYEQAHPEEYTPTTLEELIKQGGKRGQK